MRKELHFKIGGRHLVISASGYQSWEVVSVVETWCKVTVVHTVFDCDGLIVIALKVPVPVTVTLEVTEPPITEPFTQGAPRPLQGMQP